ncbi:MAG: NERD domain-containing protein [Woeseiaceae bacterium]|nr:NERD domain-containing protein [Woeseiaceae bacterium]
MQKLGTLFLTCASLAAFAADANAQTGITNAGPAVFIFTIAAALLLMLVFRSAVSYAVPLLIARAGQSRIRKALKKRSRDVLHNFLLPGAYGGLVRIDHAILTAGGIICIQTKHCNGTVFGGKDEAQWTNVDGVKRRRFLNPVIENEGRSRALRRVVPNVPVANLVIFTGSVEFTAPPPRNVIHVRDLESFIAKFVFGPSRVKDWDAVWLSVQAAAVRDAHSSRDINARLTSG